MVQLELCGVMVDHSLTMQRKNKEIKNVSQHESNTEKEKEKRANKH